MNRCASRWSRREPESQSCTAWTMTAVHNRRSAISSGVKSSRLWFTVACITFPHSGYVCTRITRDQAALAGGMHLIGQPKTRSAKVAASRKLFASRTLSREDLRLVGSLQTCFEHDTVHDRLNVRKWNNGMRTESETEVIEALLRRREFRGALRPTPPW